MDEKTMARWIAALYLLSTLFFLIQHASGVSWDFTAYVLNSRYLANGRGYFEWERPPLVPAMLLALGSPLTRASEFAFIAMVSGIYCLACIRFSQKAGVDPLLFYALSLSTFVLNFGFFAGTELLTMALVLAMLTYTESRIFYPLLALAVLTRYTNLAFTPLAYFRGKGLKDFALGVAVMALIMVPWMGYNMIAKGHPLYSVASSALMNIESKHHAYVGPFRDQLMPAFGIYILCALGGVIVSARKGATSFDHKMAAVAAITLASFAAVKEKEVRYLIYLFIPITYYCCEAIRWLTKDEPQKMFLTVCAFTFMTYTATSYYILLGPPAGLNTALTHVKRDCALASNAWIYINYQGIGCAPAPADDEIGEFLKDGKAFIIVKDPKFTAPQTIGSYKSYLSYEDRHVAVYQKAGACTRQGRLDMSYIDYRMGRGENIRLCPIVPLVC